MTRYAKKMSGMTTGIHALGFLRSESIYPPLYNGRMVRRKASLENSALVTADKTAQLEQKIKAFKTQIGEADGSLIPLRRMIRDGQQLYITARHTVVTDLSRKKTDPKSALLIDVYAQNSEYSIEPIGHMDWYVLKKVGYGGFGNMHEAMKPQNRHEERAVAKWRNSTLGFALDYDQHSQNIGTLMLAVAGITLPRVGVREFAPGALLDPAEKTYERFGIDRAVRYGKDRVELIPIEKLSNHARIDEVVSNFV